ncbi:hypothetical protein QFC21_003196 [Naganishia friedmannii]|uniref:Uncharacterized protein n=1 Tax=Naganishia friedmannii TaxID=89922 RepID=A0ACC2VRV4_9TREE|nr:hypothetical protein QFC21_003196 [Naganishia friedmannii]
MVSLRLGSTAPDFEAETTHGKIKFHEWAGAVCTTELGAASVNQGEFDKRGVKLIGLSANDVSSHNEWIKDINELSGGELKFPIIGDKDRSISTAYDMLDYQDPSNVDAKGMPFTVRTVFVIDPAKKIRLTLAYPASTGRNFAEIIRVIDSLQLGDKHRITTPVNWQPGQKVIVHPSVQGEEAEKLFPGYETVKPYLRFAEDPSKKSAQTA